jgi:hypothetical protein
LKLWSKEVALNRSLPFPQDDLPTLPLDVIEYIVKILIDDNKHATAAALNVICKDYQDCTTATLWKTVYVKATGGMEKLRGSQLWKRVTESEARMRVQ